MTREEAIECLNFQNEKFFGGQSEALKMAISVLSTDGEYIKKEDLFNKTIKRNSIWNEITNAEGKGLEEIVNDLPTYSFPDSAKDNTMEWIFDENETCSRCGYVVEGDHDIEFKFCPNCGRKAVSE